MKMYVYKIPSSELVNSSYQYYTGILLGKSRGTFFEYRGVSLENK